MAEWAKLRSCYHVQTVDSHTTVHSSYTFCAYAGNVCCAMPARLCHVMSCHVTVLQALKWLEMQLYMLLCIDLHQSTYMLVHLVQSITAVAHCIYYNAVGQSPFHYCMPAHVATRCHAGLKANRKQKTRAGKKHVVKKQKKKGKDDSADMADDNIADDVVLQGQQQVLGDLYQAIF